MEDRLAHLRRMLGMLARGEEPYGGGRFDAKYLEIDQGDAQVLSAALDELEQRRASVTTGGPPPAFTETWENGPSSRPPTAPPEELVVALPVTEEELEAPRLASIDRLYDAYRADPSEGGALPCGCEGPSATCADRAIDMGEKPPDPM
jgi:hypothetical protein